MKDSTTWSCQAMTCDAGRQRRCMHRVTTKRGTIFPTASVFSLYKYTEKNILHHCLHVSYFMPKGFEI